MKSSRGVAGGGYLVKVAAIIKPAAARNGSSPGMGRLHSRLLEGVNPVPFLTVADVIMAALTNLQDLIWRYRFFEMNGFLFFIF